MSVINVADVQEMYCWGQNNVYSTFLQQRKTHTNHTTDNVECTSHGTFIRFLRDVTLVVQLMDIVVLRMQDVLVCRLCMVLRSLAQTLLCKFPSIILFKNSKAVRKRVCCDAI